MCQTLGVNGCLARSRNQSKNWVLHVGWWRAKERPQQVSPKGGQRQRAQARASPQNWHKPILEGFVGSKLWNGQRSETITLKPKPENGKAMLLSLHRQQYSTRTRNVRKRHKPCQVFRRKRGDKGLHKTSPVTQHLESLSHMWTFSKHCRGQRKLTCEPSKHCSSWPFQTANVCSGEAALKCQE